MNIHIFKSAFTDFLNCNESRAMKLTADIIITDEVLMAINLILRTGSYFPPYFPMNSYRWYTQIILNSA